VLALRGDSIKTESSFVPEPNGHHYALDLVRQINEMNRANYLDDEMKDAAPTDFCIGIAGYPEKHFEAPNMTSDLKYLKAKVDAGAEYIVTQMFFDNKKYFEFVELCRKAGITVPIIPGLKIMASRKQITGLPKVFHIDIPQDFYEELEKCKDDKAVKQVGIEWCIQQSKELVKANVPCLHFYTMGASEATKAVAKEVF
jgi:methylenetetrahydrofolate reductase (NADPH)